MKICVDASLVIKWLIPEEGSDIALKLLKKWDNEGHLLVAPGLLDYEVGSTLRQKIVRGLLDHESLFPIIDFYKRLGILQFHLTDLVSLALPAAASLEQATIYDVSYMLVARQQECDYITADKRFYKKAHQTFSFVKYYEDVQ